MSQLVRSRATPRYALATLLLLCLVPAGGAGGSAPAANEVRITLLATTDVHGNVWPHDYLFARPAERGLAKVSTYVKSVRARQPHTLLLDSGDTFQGTPLAYLAAAKYTEEMNPTIAAMNAMRYDAMAVGNHEFNFGLRPLWRFKEMAQFPILGANIVSTYHDPIRDFEPYVIREVGGVRVAILGLVTPSIPRWDPPEHRTGYEFRDLVSTAKQHVPKLRRKADVVVVLVHSGLGRDPQTGAVEEGSYPEEDRAWDLAEQVPGIDVILFGHSHRELPGKVVNGVLLVQPKNWAQSVGEVELRLVRDGKKWKLQEKHSRLVPMDASIPPDEAILGITRAAHERAEEYLNTVVAKVEKDLSGRAGRLEDNALVELINRVQLHYGQADVSLATLFTPTAFIREGPVTLRDLYRLYLYENKLVTIEVTGAQLKEALERSARELPAYPWPSAAPSLPGYSFDMAEGVSYQIDLRRVPGERIVNLTLEGQPLDPARKLRLAFNSYRWSGGGSYNMLRHGRVVHKVDEQIRELLIQYVQERGQVDTKVDSNWEIIPDEARQALIQFATAPRPPAAGSN
jgi:2',3'-cyclic-nucleotide 2'-phosphodiesterase/3'-nucleotidase